MKEPGLVQNKAEVDDVTAVEVSDERRISVSLCSTGRKLVEPQAWSRQL